MHAEPTLPSFLSSSRATGTFLARIESILPAKVTSVLTPLSFIADPSCEILLRRRMPSRIAKSRLGAAYAHIITAEGRTVTPDMLPETATLVSSP